MLGTALAAIVVCGIGRGTARADDDFAGGTVIFARGAALYQIDADGRHETEIAQLPTRLVVRALRSDADGHVLLADLTGTWAWMPLDRSTTALTELPCADGPAQLAEDGSAVVCRSPSAANHSILVELTPGPARRKLAPIDLPPGAVRLIGTGADRKLVWADASGVWTASPLEPQNKTRVAQDAPQRGFLPSPDGTRAIGVYADQLYTDVRHTQLAEVLMTLQLDGRGARRTAIRDGIAVEWSHDSQWLLVQDGPSACIMRAVGGQYKCWKGFTAASLSSDGRWGLVLGSRSGSKKPPTAKLARKPAPRPAVRVRPPSEASDAGALGDKPWDHLDEPSDEPESGDAPPDETDMTIAPPTGPLSLYRIRLEGAFTDRPTLLAKIIDGAAVWVP